MKRIILFPVFVIAFLVGVPFGVIIVVGLVLYHLVLLALGKTDNRHQSYPDYTELSADSEPWPGV